MQPDLAVLAAMIAGAGLAAQWLAWRTRLPAIVLLIATGLILGPWLGWLEPTADLGPLLMPMIGIAVAIILFEGGLSLHWHEFKDTAAAVKRLVILGIPIGWLLGAAAARWIGGLSWPTALLFGAIIVVTGPTVILPLLRHARLERRPAAYLKWEGIVNDPLGALLAVLVYEYFAYAYASGAPGHVAGGMVAALGSALVVGGLGGFLLGSAFRRGYVPEYLKPPILLAAVLVAYAVADLIQAEAGLLAVTVFGLVVGNLGLPSIGELRQFKEAVTVLLVSGVFILLTADLNLDHLARLDWRHAALLATVLVVVRPVTVWLSTLGAGVPLQERVLLAWIAPRGIVAAAIAGFFAPRMVELGYSDAEVLVPLVFALVLLTVTLHGLTLAPLARRLQLAATHDHGLLIVGASSWATALAEALHKIDVPVILADAFWYRLRAARLAGLSVLFGEILSERTGQSLDLHEMGYVLAATPNDAYNALLCSHFAHEFGRTHVFQLPTNRLDEQAHRAVNTTRRGVFVWGRDGTYEDLLRRHYRGWSFQRTRFTDAYTYEDYALAQPPDRLELLIRRPSGSLVFAQPDKPLKPRSGDILIAFIPPKADTEPGNGSRAATRDGPRDPDSARGAAAAGRS